MLELNNTPVRTSKNFNINNIKIDKKNIPSSIKNFDNVYSTNRFLNQINAFEYLYDKIDHAKAQNTKFSLKQEIEEMLKEYIFLLSTNDNLSNIAEDLKIILMIY